MRATWLAAILVMTCATPAYAVDAEGARKKFFVGAAMFEDGEYGAAIPYLEKAIELDPGFCRVHYYLAKSYHETGSDKARASAEAYKDCATDGEQADADALLALIPAGSGGSDATASSGGGSSSSRSDDDDDGGGSSRRWEEDDDEDDYVARYDDDDDGGGRRRWEEDDEDEDDSSSRDDDDEEEDDVSSSSRDDDDEDEDDSSSRWDDEEEDDDRWDDDEDDEVGSGSHDDDEDDSDSYDNDEDEDDDRGGAYNASANTGASATYSGSTAAVSLKRRRTAGGVMLGVGAGVAVGGFIMSYAMYSQYYWEPDTPTYTWSRNMNIAGFAIGVAGAAIAGTGLLLAILPDSSKRSAAIIPGPVTTVTFAF